MSSGSGGGSSDAKLYKHSAEELQYTLDNILEAHLKLNQRAIDLVKIDLLSASVIVASVSISNVDPSILSVAGLIALIYSIWNCVKIYHPRDFKRGIGHQTAVEIDKDLKNGMSEKEYYRTIVYTYTDPVETAKSQFEVEKEYFQTGLWASVASILLFAIVAMTEFMYRLSPIENIIACLLVIFVVWWGKINTNAHYN